jgi:hypothetical protein
MQCIAYGYGATALVFAGELHVNSLNSAVRRGACRWHRILLDKSGEDPENGQRNCHRSAQVWSY